RRADVFIAHRRVRQIIFQDDNGVRRRFDVNQVRGIDFDNVTNSAVRNEDVRSPAPPPPPDRRPDAYYDQRTGAPPNNSANRYEERGRDWTVIPAGASLSVRS